MSSLLYDPTLPASLRHTQEWFGSLIGKPLLSPLNPHQQEAEEILESTPTLHALERLSIYREQYWWRLLKVLREQNPGLVRLLGFKRFDDTIATPYLMKHPPNHWSFIRLGDELVSWLHHSYQGKEQALIQHMAQIDRACFLSFCTAKRQPPDVAENNVEALFDKTLILQPHLAFFSLKQQLLAFRDLLMSEQGDYWVHHARPPILAQKTYFLILYRNGQNRIAWVEVFKEAYHFLERFREGSTLKEALEWSEAQGKTFFCAVEKHLAQWLHIWTALKWFAKP